jgi:hypothetical protein
VLHYLTSKRILTRIGGDSGDDRQLLGTRNLCRRVYFRGRDRRPYVSSYGRRFLTHTFKSDEAIVQPVHILLNLGFYLLLCIGLFLWNIGIGGSGYSQENIYFQVIEDAALRLGVSIFVIGAFHSVNILVLAILNRKNT